MVVYLCIAVANIYNYTQYRPFLMEKFPLSYPGRHLARISIFVGMNTGIMRKYLLSIIVVIAAFMCGCTKIETTEIFYGIDDRNITEVEAGAKDRFEDEVYDVIYDNEDDEEKMKEQFTAVCATYDGKLSGDVMLVKGTGKVKQSGEIVIVNPMLLEWYFFE